MFVATKHVFCRDKRMLAVVYKHVFVARNVLSGQAYFVSDKRRVLSQQTRVCRNKSKLFVATKTCFVVTKNDTCGSSRQ